MNNKTTTDNDTDRYRLTKTIYAVGIDPAISPKEKITKIYGTNSSIVKAAQVLEAFITDPDFRQSCEYRRFFSKVQRLMGFINGQANGYVKGQMAQDFIDELIHDGYLHCLKSLSLPSGHEYVKFASSYAQDQNMPLGAALLFGPTGGTRTALRNFIVAEASHGQHRPVTARGSMVQTTRQRWFKADNTVNWSSMIEEKDNEKDFEIADDYNRIPDDPNNRTQQLWGRHKSFRDYSGTNRLAGDISFQLIEDAVDIILRSPLVSPGIKSRYDQIVKSANHKGIDPFYAVYKQMFNCSDRLGFYWDRARLMLYEYSLKLWQNQNKQLLLKGQRIPAVGVTYRAKCSIKKPKNKIPGTIYPNGNRYYWAVAGKMKAVPLLDPATAPKFPGTILKSRNRYYWSVPRFLIRQRLIPEGEKFSANDRTIAEKIVLKKWKEIQKDQPALASKILKHAPIKCLAAKDKQTAQKVALKMWQDIQKNNPELAAKLLTSKRPKPSGHWHAQIKANGKVRFVGSFKTRKEAEDAYKLEFEKVHGYPVGYNIQSIPKMDKVWPTWQEQKKRLETMDVRPTMPVIGFTDKAKSIVPVIDRMQKVDWIAYNCMVVLEDNAPRAILDIAVQSRGQLWCGEIKEKGKNISIYGSTAIDKDSQRIRVTLFSPAFKNCAVLAEEVYHIVYRIIGNTRPEMSKKIRHWYSKRLRAGLDPTLSEDEAFAQAMAYEDVAYIKSDLPRDLVQHAKKVFSPTFRVPASVFKNITANAGNAAL